MPWESSAGDLFAPSVRSRTGSGGVGTPLSVGRIVRRRSSHAEVEEPVPTKWDEMGTSHADVRREFAPTQHHWWYAKPALQTLSRIKREFAGKVLQNKSGFDVDWVTVDSSNCSFDNRSMRLHSCTAAMRALLSSPPTPAANERRRSRSAVTGKRPLGHSGAHSVFTGDGWVGTYSNTHSRKPKCPLRYSPSTTTSKARATAACETGRVTLRQQNHRRQLTARQSANSIPAPQGEPFQWRRAAR